MSSKLKGCRPYGVTFGLFSYIFYSRYFKGLSIVNMKSGKEKKAIQISVLICFSRGVSDVINVLLLFELALPEVRSAFGPSGHNFRVIKCQRNKQSSLTNGF